jgi:hypothetical protein
MCKNIILTFTISFLIVFSLRAEEINAETKNNYMETKMAPAIYIQTKQQNGEIKEEKLVLTNENKSLLNKSLEGIISLFEETARSLREKKSDFEIGEVEIYASLQGEASVWVVKGATEASFKIILHPTKNKKEKGH